MEFIDLKHQYRAYKTEILARIDNLLEHGQYIMGPEVEELEGILASHVGVKHCITTSNGTVSLELALRALGVGPGDEVITVPFSWISTAEVIPWVGAIPVFVDIDPRFYTMNPELLEKAITAKTKAIIAVSLYGQMPDMESINATADKYGIPVIEDAAQSFGASRNGTQSCGASTIGSTSFFPAKPFGCYGDGGALFTDDDDVAQKLREIRTHGGEFRHHHTQVGTNGRFDTLQAAILLAKWPHFHEEIQKRNELGTRYSDLLKNSASAPEVMEGNTHVYGQYTVRVSASDRSNLQSELRKHGIPTAVYYPKCLHEQPVFSPLGYCIGSFPESEKASKEVLSLPMHPFLQDNDLEIVASSIKQRQHYNSL